MQGRTEVSMNLLGGWVGKSVGHGTNFFSNLRTLLVSKKKLFFFLVQILREQSQTQNSLTLYSLLQFGRYRRNAYSCSGVCL